MLEICDRYPLFEFASVVLNDKHELSILWINQIVEAKRKVYYSAEQAKKKCISKLISENGGLICVRC